MRESVKVQSVNWMIVTSVICSSIHKINESRSVANQLITVLKETMKQFNFFLSSYSLAPCPGEIPLTKGFVKYTRMVTV